MSSQGTLEKVSRVPCRVPLKVSRVPCRVPLKV